ncbi:MAG TPA: CopG family transcriptional regulator [Chloroflexota bacterium]|jgi:predicted HicB family RNase H-like nuclease
MAKVTARRGERMRTKGGDALTEQEIEALAAEAEAGYDLSRARRQRSGRPSLGEGVSPRVSFRASPALYQAARDRAAREGRSVSELAREAVERYVAS